MILDRFRDRPRASNKADRPENDELPNPARRRALKQMGRLALGAGCFALGAVAERKKAFLLQLIKNEADSDEIAQTMVDFIKSGYGIDVVNGEPPDLDISGESLSIYDFRRMLDVVISELDKYPPDMFKAEDLTMYISATIQAHHGVAEKSALAGHAASLWLPKMKNVVIGAQVVGVQSTIHHELFHIKDMPLADASDTYFRLLHKECGRCGAYGNERDRAAYAAASNPARKTPFFASAYASTSPREERAVIAEMLMMPDTHNALMTRIEHERDPDARAIMAKKVAHVKQLYERWSGGEMDERYWDRLTGTTGEQRPFDDGTTYTDWGFAVKRE